MLPVIFSKTHAPTDLHVPWPGLQRTFHSSAQKSPAQLYFNQQHSQPYRDVFQNICQRYQRQTLLYNYHQSKCKSAKQHALTNTCHGAYE